MISVVHAYCVHFNVFVTLPQSAVTVATAVAVHTKKPKRSKAIFPTGISSDSCLCACVSFASVSVRALVCRRHEMMFTFYMYALDSICSFQSGRIIIAFSLFLTPNEPYLKVSPCMRVERQCNIQSKRIRVNDKNKISTKQTRKIMHTNRMCESERGECNLLSSYACVCACVFVFYLRSV